MTAFFRRLPDRVEQQVAAHRVIEVGAMRSPCPDGRRQVGIDTTDARDRVVGLSGDIHGVVSVREESQRDRRGCQARRRGDLEQAARASQLDDETGARSSRAHELGRDDDAVARHARDRDLVGTRDRDRFAGLRNDGLRELRCDRRGERVELADHRGQGVERVATADGQQVRAVGGVGEPGAARRGGRATHA